MLAGIRLNTISPTRIVLECRQFFCRKTSIARSAEMLCLADLDDSLVEFQACSVLLNSAASALVR